jgi:translation initiation factor IF-3
MVTQGGHISTEPRINERIRVPEVRLVGPAGEQVGIVAIQDALRLAQEADLDLVEVAPMARPPVAKLMDYGKFKYESALKARESRKNQAQTVIKEIKLRPKIDPHDYGTKKGHVERFLKQGDKVKVTIMFRGREQSRPELGFKLLQKLAADVEELGFVESTPKQDGRNMIMVIGPHKRKTEAMTAAKPERVRPSRASASQEERAHAAAAAAPAKAPAAPAEAPAAPAEAPAAPAEAPAAPAEAPADATAAQSSQTAEPAPSQTKPAAPTSRPAAPRPQPRPGPSSGGSAAPKPTAPRTAASPAPRPGAGSAGPRPTAPRSTAARAGAGSAAGGSSSAGSAGTTAPAASTPRPMPTPRAVAADRAARQPRPSGSDSES